MSWLEDHLWANMNKVDTGPRWMKGRFGTLVYLLGAALFILIGVAAGIKLLVDGPAERIPVSDNPPDSENSKGAF